MTLDTLKHLPRLGFIGYQLFCFGHNITMGNINFDKLFEPNVKFWITCMKTGAIYKRPYSEASIKTNLHLIKHFLKHLKADFSNIREAYLRTKIESAHMTPKSQLRLYYTVVSFVKSLVEGGVEF
jgi:hypothetical protein